MTPVRSERDRDRHMMRIAATEVSPLALAGTLDEEWPNGYASRSAQLSVVGSRTWIERSSGQRSVTPHAGICVLMPARSSSRLARRADRATREEATMPTT